MGWKDVVWLCAAAGLALWLLLRGAAKCGCGVAGNKCGSCRNCPGHRKAQPLD